MSVTHDEVRRIARLAELDVSDDALPLLAEQMSRILEYVAQINAVPASEAVKPFVPGPDAVRFRPDEVKPWPLAFGPAELAPAFRDGFFLVPKLRRSAGKRQGGGRPHRQSQATERLSHAHQGAAQVAGGTGVGGA